LTTFILNNKKVETHLPPGTLVLDYVRYHQQLKGTKIGCREGDCGACTVLIGQLIDGELVYQSATSCLTPLGNVQNRHVVTIEGLNMDELNPIQQAMCDEGGTQCGFCTPGFIVSMAGFCLSSKEPTHKNAVTAVNGNICRCTGYKSIERALVKLNDLMQERQADDAIDYVTSKSILPAYFSGIKDRLLALHIAPNGEHQPKSTKKHVGGGTDLYVQQHDTMVYADIDFLSPNQQLKGISKQNNTCTIGSATTVTELIKSPIIQAYFPKIESFTKLVSSTPIQNIATLAGNFINASPIGDFSIFFLALDTTIELTDGETSREVALKKLYKGYKQLDKQADEYVSRFWFDLPDQHTLFNFEKVSKRTHLDIASVNTAIKLVMNFDTIETASLSAGGVGPTPLLLIKTNEFLQGGIISEELILEAITIAQTEIAPISDARGTEEYKRFLLSQLIKAHFMKLFPRLEISKLLNLPQPA
jgi:xanthine dehydrogenase small subunit